MKPLTRSEAMELLAVSEDRMARLDAYLELLSQWQERINLVGPSTLADPWRRHILDTAQLREHIPATAQSLIDLGSGAGLPGLILAILGTPNVTLVEADRRKAIFLREAARITECPAVETVNERIEKLSIFADVITARALAPLPKLLGLAVPRMATGGRCLFLKGRDVERELTAARQIWTMRVDLVPSRTAAEGRILVIEEVRPVRRTT